MWILWALNDSFYATENVIYISPCLCRIESNRWFWNVHYMCIYIHQSVDCSTKQKQYCCELLRFALTNKHGLFPELYLSVWNLLVLYVICLLELYSAMQNLLILHVTCLCRRELWCIRKFRANCEGTYTIDIRLGFKCYAASPTSNITRLWFWWYVP